MRGIENTPTNRIQHSCVSMAFFLQMHTHLIYIAIVYFSVIVPACVAWQCEDLSQLLQEHVRAVPEHRKSPA